MYNKLIILFITLILLSACGIKPKPYSFTPEQRARAYTVRGETYYPLVNAQGFVEKGHASWYGPGFHGKLTASGEVYDQNDMTAAHKHLPLGTYVYVQHIENKKIIRVKVNDRGPFIEGRVIDLSKEAAKEIGMFDQGVADVVIAYDKSDLDSAPTFIASRDNNSRHSSFKNKDASSSSTSGTAAQAKVSSSSPSVANAGGASSSSSVMTPMNTSAAANPNMRTWSFQSSGKTYHDLRKEQYPESLTSIYTDDGTNPNPSYASTLNNTQSSEKPSSRENATPVQESNTSYSQASSVSANSTQTSVANAAQPAPIQGKGTVFIQLGSYKTIEEAQKNAQIVHSLGMPTTIKSGSSIVLLSGPFETRKKAYNSRAVLQFRFPRAKVL